MVLIDELSRQVRACTICKDLPLGPKPLFKIHEQVKILIVGQAPGRKTHEAGRPFLDASGVRLREWLGVDDDTFYNDPRIGILPMGFCFPGTGKGGDLPPRAECEQNWRRQMLDVMPHVELTIIIGKYARDWHLPDRIKESITQTVSDWQVLLPECLPTPHPSPRNNRWLKNNPWFEQEVVPRLQERVRVMLDE